MEKKEKKVRKKRNKYFLITSLIFFIVGFICTIILTASAINSGLFPLKYISFIAFIIIALLGLLLFTKSKILNVLGMILVIIVSPVSIIGTNYISKTYNALKDIVSEKKEYVDYHILVLKSSEITTLDELKDNEIGISLQEKNDNLASSLVSINATLKEYSSVGELIYGLELNEVKAIAISSTLYSYLLEENETLTDMFTDLSTINVEGKVDTITSDIEIGSSFIVYISGIDTRDTSSVSPYGLSDVNILAVVNPTTHKVLLVNTPRDYYIQVHGTTGYRDKLTHAGLYGIEVSQKTMEDLYDININAYLKVNFAALTTLVDEIGGIDVYSDTAFNSYHLRGWYVKKGVNHMDGKKALAYARERYAYASGDRHRGQNQQDVITAIIDKVSQDKSILLKYTDILNAVNPYVSTNVEIDDVQGLIKEQIESMPKWEVESISVNGTNSRNYTHSFPKQSSYVMEPIQSTIDTAKEKIAVTMKGE